MASAPFTNKEVAPSTLLHPANNIAIAKLALLTSLFRVHIKPSERVDALVMVTEVFHTAADGVLTLLLRYHRLLPPPQTDDIKDSIQA